jgi:hypothetical protein
MQPVQHWPSWLKVTSLFVLGGIAQGIIGGRADAIFVWTLPVLWRQITLFGGDLFLIAAIAWFLGMVSFLFINRTRRPIASDISTVAVGELEQSRSAKATATPREEAVAELAEVLQEIAQGKTTFLPQILGRLQFIFDRLDKGDDATWCQAELSGYPPDATPDYRYADVTIDWRSTAGVAYMNRVTGEVAGRPPERTESIPLNDPVGNLLRISQSGRRNPTGKIQLGLMESWREIVVIDPEAVQGVLRRILQEGYRRAMAAHKAVEVA